MVSTIEEDTTKKEFLHNILVGVVLLLLIIPFAVILSQKMVPVYGSGNNEIASRIVLVFGTFILLIYSMIVLLVKFIIYTLREDPDNPISQSSHQITNNWYKWLIVIFIIFILTILFIELRKGYG